MVKLFERTWTLEGIVEESMYNEDVPRWRISGESDDSSDIWSIINMEAFQPRLFDGERYHVLMSIDVFDPEEDEPVQAVQFSFSGFLVENGLGHPEISKGANGPRRNLVQAWQELLYSSLSDSARIGASRIARIYAELVLLNEAYEPVKELVRN